MRIKLENISKRYRKEWIFRNLSCEFSQGKSYAIAGPNGSGKSTLIRILSGYLTPTNGKIQWDEKISIDSIYKYLGIAAPYVALIDEFSLKESIRFHSSFKEYVGGLNEDEIISLLELQQHADKQLHDFSSGMKQRVKLALSLFFQNDLVLLDEPTNNLDTIGIDWYRKMIEQFCKNRLIIIASNQEHDFDFCEERIEIRNYKK